MIHTVLLTGKESDPDLMLKTLALPCQQKVLVESKKINEQFKNTLTAIAQTSTLASQPTVFISYAWPTPENLSNEYWIQPFLKQLGMHLHAAGLTVMLDIGCPQLIGVDIGNNIIEFMEQAKHA